MNLKRTLLTATTALAIAASGVLATNSPALARESSLSSKDNCYIWTGNVTKPTASTRSVKISVRCPYNQTVSYAYVGLWKDVSLGTDQAVGTNVTLWGAGTTLTGNTTYTKTVTWNSSASNTYARMTFKNTRWTFPVVVESGSNA